MADDTNNLTQGLSGMMNLADPSLLISVGLGLMSGARYGSNAGEGIMQGLQMYQGMKTNQLNQQLMRQQIQTGQLGLQRQQMLTNAAQQAFQGDQGGQPPQAASPAPSPPQTSQPFLPGVSPMPSGAPPAGVSVPPTATPQGDAPGLTAPSMAQIYGTTYPGGMPANFVRGMSYLSADPLGAQQKFRDDQLKLAQQQYAPTIAKLDQLIKSDQPAKYLNGTGFSDIKAAWPQLAQEVGLDPEKDYNDPNVRMALSNRRNQLASSLQEPTSTPAMPVKTFKLPDGRVVQQEPDTGKWTVIPSAKPESVLGADGKPTLVPEGLSYGLTPFNQVTYGNAQMQDPKIGALDAALTSMGINLPGNRNSGQYAMRLQNLITNNPNVTPQELAQQIRTGQLDFNGAKRTTAQLATLAGAADVQSRKIEKDLDSLGQIIPRLSGGPAKLASIMTNLQKDWSWNGDKDSTEAVGYVKELSGEYAKLVSGSTGMAAPAEGEMKSALGLMQSALTQNGYAGMHEFLLTTSKNRRDAVKEGLSNAAAPGYATGQSQGNVGGAKITLQPGQSHSVGGFTVTRVN